jgi:hypothetical protein
MDLREYEHYLIISLLQDGKVGREERLFQFDQCLLVFSRQPGFIPALIGTPPLLQVMKHIDQSQLELILYIFDLTK